MVVIRESRADFFKRSSRQEKQRKAKRISSSRATSVTRRTNKGTATVTKEGLVTERDSKGNLISRYNTDPSKAKEFVALESFKISRNVEIKRQIASRQKILKKAGNIRARTLPREGGGTVTVTKSGQVTERNSKGQVVRKFRTSASQAVNFLNIKTPKRLPIVLPGFKPTLPSGPTKLPSKQQVDLFRKKEAILAKGGFKKISGVIDVPKKEKGIKELQRLTAAEKRKQLGKIEDLKTGAAERQLRSIAVLGGLGLLRGGLAVIQTISRPDKAALNLIAAAVRPDKTIKLLYNEFKIDPAGVAAEFYAYSKALNLVGKLAKSSKVGRFVKEELFIRSQPKKIQLSVRRIIKAAKVQEKLNPNKIRSLKSVNFFEVKSLTRIEAIALKKTLLNTDSVVFGSVSSRAISKGKTPLPKDVDIATRSITQFNNLFIKNMPKKLRANYILKGEKLIRKSSGVALFDIKPMSRLIPSRNLFTRKGQIPAVGYVKKLVKKEGSLLPKLVRKKVTGKLTVPTQKLQKVGKGKIFITFEFKTKSSKFGFKRDPFNIKKHFSKSINKNDISKYKVNSKNYDFHKIDVKSGLGVTIPKKYHTLLHAIENNFIKGKGTRFYKLLRKRSLKAKDISQLKTVISKVNKDSIKLAKIFDKKLLPKKTLIPKVGIKTTGQIKLTGFGEQTTRKGLGTLQVLIEKNVRRAKDPQSFLIGLEIQLKFLKKSKPKTTIGKIQLRRKVNTLDSAIKLLKSKQFSKLLESKVKGITKNYPLVNKINVKQLKKITPARTKKGVALALRTNKIPFVKTSSLPKSRLPKSKVSSRLPKTKVSKSKLPSKVRKSGLTKSKLPSKIPKSSLLLKPSIPNLSRLPKIRGSFIPKSQIPKSSFLNSVFNKPSRLNRAITSIIPLSRIPPSKIPNSKVPGSRIPPSKIPSSKLPPVRRVRKFTPVKEKPKKYDNDDKKKKQLTKLTKSKIKNQKFIYIPDLYSVIYGVKASAKTRANLLKKGRVFSGISIRKLV